MGVESGGLSASRWGVGRPSPRGQNDWQALLKTLPCPKLRLRAVKSECLNMKIVNNFQKRYKNKQGQKNPHTNILQSTIPQNDHSRPPSLFFVENVLNFLWKFLFIQKNPVIVFQMEFDRTRWFSLWNSGILRSGRSRGCMSADCDELSCNWNGL